ncbi:hypothetical protein EIN_179420, partial [Entamoeba invadens IP1]|uniref:hypothetical protein n=1 Tax=Entamoeba invadens IP1 TaxID=370355 RepID=UPI0002C3DB10
QKTKLNILQIFAGLSDKSLKTPSKIYTQIITFCANSILLPEEHVTTATVVLTRALSFLDDETLISVSESLLALKFWKLDFGKEWCDKNMTDPHEVLSVLLSNKAVSTYLEHKEKSGSTTLKYIAVNLIPHSLESLSATLSLISLIPEDCTLIVNDLINLFPFDGDVDSCVSTSQVFVLYITKISATLRKDILPTIIQTLDPFQLLNPAIQDAFNTLKEFTQ